MLARRLLARTLSHASIIISASTLDFRACFQPSCQHIITPYSLLHVSVIKPPPPLLEARIFKPRWAFRRYKMMAMINSSLLLRRHLLTCIPLFLWHDAQAFRHTSFRRSLGFRFRHQVVSLMPNSIMHQRAPAVKPRDGRRTARRRF